MFKSPILWLVVGMVTASLFLSACQSQPTAEETIEVQQQVESDTSGPVPADPEIDAAVEKMNSEMDGTNDADFEAMGLSETELNQ